MFTAISLLMFLVCWTYFMMPFEHSIHSEDVKLEYSVFVVIKTVIVSFTLTAGVWCLFKAYVWC